MNPSARIHVMQQEPTALVIPVREAAFVQPFRVKHLQRPGVAIPPHVTVHIPFEPIGNINATVMHRLATLFAAHQPFWFSLTRTAYFAETEVLYLVPEPVEPFLALCQAIQANFPGSPPDYPDPVMHLTLARAGSEELESITDEFYRTYGSQLPIAATATEVWLFEKRGNVWVEVTSFALGSVTTREASELCGD